MSDNVDTTIEKLRHHLGAESDVELGRKLRVSKSTISSWRARGVIPLRYKKILNGDSHQMVLVPMDSWSEEEQLSFALALFRFGRATADVVSKGDYRANLILFKQGYAISFLASDCQREIAEFLETGDHDTRTAFALIMHQDLEHGDTAIDRTREKLREILMSTVDGL